jgi:hypothetical protein
MWCGSLNNTDMTDIQLNIIEAINQQAINISNSSTLHYPETCQIYKETLNIQFLLLANHLNIEDAQEVLKRGSEILNKESNALLKILKENDTESVKKSKTNIL